MPRYYSFEKGKYGGATGTIYPFVRTLSGNEPSGEDWTTFVPAGYLRCDGSILKAESYRRLAEIIGIGDDCIYKKQNIILENVDDNGFGGEIQLPDLGSKYITAFSSNTGLILDDQAENPNSPSTTAEKVGVGVSLTLNQGTSIGVSYSGNLVIPQTDIPITGNYALSLQSISPAGYITDTQMLAHGHYANAARLKEDSTESPDASTNERQGSSGNIKFSGTGGYNWIEYESQGVPSTGSSSTTEHFHTIQRTAPTDNIAAVVNQINDVPGDGIVTTVNLASENTTAFNDINPPFILVEYLIKF